MKTSSVRFQYRAEDRESAVDIPFSAFLWPILSAPLGYACRLPITDSSSVFVGEQIEDVGVYPKACPPALRGH